MKKTLVFVILFIMLFGISVVNAHGDTDVDYDGHHGGMMGEWNIVYGFGFGWLVMLLIIIALILFIVWLIKQIQVQDKIKRRKKK